MKLKSLETHFDTAVEKTENALLFSSGETRLSPAAARRMPRGRAGFKVSISDGFSDFQSQAVVTRTPSATSLCE
jgi:hypothetical protein